MFKISLNKIYLTKGDTARFTISLVDLPGVKQDYELSETDSIYFIVTKTPDIVDINSLDDNNSCIFYKQGVSIILEPEDTKDLEEGVYYYQVRVILGESGDLNTIIEPEEFHITPIRGW